MRWYSNTEIFCGLPSSSTVKSSWLQSLNGLAGLILGGDIDNDQIGIGLEGERAGVRHGCFGGRGRLGRGSLGGRLLRQRRCQRQRHHGCGLKALIRHRHQKANRMASDTVRVAEAAVGRP